MPESQVPPQATPPQATSPSEPPRQQEPPRRVGDPPRKSAKKPSGAPDEQAAQRAKQLEVRAAVEKKNPFSPANRAARMQNVMNTLREERGVPPPREKASANEQGGQDSSGSDAAGGAAQPAGQPDNGLARSEAVEPKAENKSDKPSTDEQPEWYKREQAAQASERKASEALANAERVRADTEKAKADAEAAVKRLADAKDDPIQFMAEAGMTKDEWNAYVANGGVLSPEQKKMRTMAENMAKMQARLDAAEKNAQTQQEQAQRAAEEAGFAASLQEMVYVPQMGGMAAVRARQSLLSQKTGQAVTLRDAAQHLEQEMGAGLERLLQNPKIRSNLKLDVNTSLAGQAAETPRTLNNTVSAQSSQTEAKPHPLDFAAKRKLWAQRMQRDQETRIGR